MTDETTRQPLPAEIDGDVMIRSSDDGVTALEGWVSSFHAHREVLDSARALTGARVIEDRLIIILGRQGRR
jgi:hypothetical protein